MDKEKDIIITQFSDTVTRCHGILNALHIILNDEGYKLYKEDPLKDLLILLREKIENLDELLFDYTKL